MHRTLFGYARAHVTHFLERHWSDPEVRADVGRLAAEHPAEGSQTPVPSWRDNAAAVAGYVHWLMDQDRKSTGLKSLQGKIWEEGYRAGDLRSEVYPDVPPALERWQRDGIDIAIFSSGSVQAQRSLFRSTAAGDLTPFIRGYFDTTTGAKTAPESYADIGRALGVSPTGVLFISDIAAELDAAAAAGMRTALCVRTPEAITPSVSHPVVHTFDRLPG